MSELETVRYLFGWVLLAGFASVIFSTLLYWWLKQRKVLVLKGMILAAGEPNTLVLLAELIILPLIAIWALVEAVLIVKGVL